MNDWYEICALTKVIERTMQGTSSYDVVDIVEPLVKAIRIITLHHWDEETGEWDKSGERNDPD